LARCAGSVSAFFWRNLFAITLRFWISIGTLGGTDYARRGIEVPSPTPTAAPSASSARPPTLSGKFDVSLLFQWHYGSKRSDRSSGRAASEERVDAMSLMRSSLKLRVRVPTPKSTVDSSEVSPISGSVAAAVWPRGKAVAVSLLLPQLYDQGFASSAKI